MAWIIRDETDRKRAEQDRERLVLDLERSNEDLSHFAFAVSHDLQAPVRTIHAFTELLTRRAEGKLEASEIQLVDTIAQAADRMRRLIESMLQYAQAGQGYLNREPVPIRAVIDSIQSTLASDIAETQAQVRFGWLPTVQGDRTQLEQLFQNLIDNAIRYRSRGKRPIVRISGEEIQGG